MRSSSGPEMRFWYLVTVEEEQVQGLVGLAVLAARAGVHRADQLEIGREGQRALRARDGHGLVFHGLAQDFQHARAELGQLVQEEHAAVGQGDLAGVGVVAAADQPGKGDGVMRGAERPRCG